MGRKGGEGEALVGVCRQVRGQHDTRRVTPEVQGGCVEGASTSEQRSHSQCKRVVWTVWIGA